MPGGRLIMAVFLAAVCGCSNEHPTSASNPTPAPPEVPSRPVVAFTLSAPRAVVAPTTVAGNQVTAVKWSVHYRVMGTPAADEWFEVSAEGDAGTLYGTFQLQGKAIKPEGEFEGAGPVLRMPPKAITIKVLRGKGQQKGAYENGPVGGPVTCPVKAV
jgi:hypothetical protein